MASVELRGVTKRFGSHVALEDLCLPIADGEFVAVVGPTSCGKSTLLRLVGGLETMGSGDLFIGGRSMQQGGRPATATSAWCRRSTRSTRT